MTNDSGKGRRYGQTYAEVEYLLHSGGDKGLAWNTLRKIRAAEKRRGFETGARFKIVDGRPVQHRISVMFYPKTTFWIAEALPDGSLGTARILEKSEYDETFGLKL